MQLKNVQKYIHLFLFKKIKIIFIFNNHFQIHIHSLKYNNIFMITMYLYIFVK